MAKDKEASQDGLRLEDKDKGKVVKPLLEAKNTKAAFTIKDSISKAKDAEPKSKAVDPKSKVTDPKDDPSQAKA